MPSLSRMAGEGRGEGSSQAFQLATRSRLPAALTAGAHSAVSALR